MPSPAGEDVEAAPAAAQPPVGRTTPFSRRTVAPEGVAPPERTDTGALSATPPATFRGAATAPAGSPAYAPPPTPAEVEGQRVAALEARRSQAAERPTWFLPSPPTAPVSTSPFNLVSSRPPSGPSPEELAEAAAAQELAEQQAAQAEQARQRQADLAREAALEEQRLAEHEAAQQVQSQHADLRRFHDAAGATVVHPDALRGALSTPVGPPTPVIPPISDTPAPRPPTDLVAPFGAVPGVPVSATPPLAAQGLLSAAAPNPAPAATAAPEAPARGRLGRARRAGRRSRPPELPSATDEAQAAEARAQDQRAEDERAQDAALEAYRRFAREGSMITEDYYRGPAGAIEEERAPTVVLAESLIPTGKPRLAPQSDKPRGPKIVSALVVLAIAGGGYYYETHQTAAPAPVGTPAVTLDETTATTGATFVVPAASTSGASYRLTVPAGWKAVSQPTRPGGDHLDVAVTEPILGLSVSVRSEAATAPDTQQGTRVDTALRVFGRPAGIVAPSTAAGSATVSRVATVTVRGVRYAVTLTVPRESAARDYGRADAVARSLTGP